jgi:hypothetical protein
MRNGAPRIGGPRQDDTMVDQHAAASEPRFVSHLKNSLSFASRGARLLGDLPKNCHLLPSTAILEPQKPLRPLGPFHSFVAFRGHAGQPGPRAENREQGREEPRCQAVIEGQFVP